MLRLLLFLLAAVYPFIVFFGLSHLGPFWLGLILALLIVARLVLTGQVRTLGGRLAMAVLVLFLAALWWRNDETVLRFYPVLVNMGLLLAFGLSLIYPPTLIERGLKLAGREVPDHAIPYLRVVTGVWCAFFIVNGSIAAWTAIAAPLGFWTLYNGLYSYLLIGLLLGGEFVVRHFYKKRFESDD